MNLNLESKPSFTALELFYLEQYTKHYWEKIYYWAYTCNLGEKRLVVP